MNIQRAILPRYEAKLVVIGKKKSIMKNKYSSHGKHCNCTLAIGHSCWIHYFLNNRPAGSRMRLMGIYLHIAISSDLSLFWHQHIVISGPRVCNHIKWRIIHQWKSFSCLMYYSNCRAWLKCLRCDSASHPIATGCEFFWRSFSRWWWVKSPLPKANCGLQ